MNLRLYNNYKYFYQNTISRKVTKAKDPNLTMNHGCPKADAKPEFQYHRGIVINFIIIILSDNFPEQGLFSWLLQFVKLEDCLITFKCFAPWIKS